MLKKYHHKCLIGIPIGLLITLPRSQNDKYMYAISIPNEYCENLVLFLMTLSHYKIYSVSFLCLSFQVLLNHSFLGPLGGKQSKIYINTIKKNQFSSNEYPPIVTWLLVKVPWSFFWGFLVPFKFMNLNIISKTMHALVYKFIV